MKRATWLLAAALCWACGSKPAAPAENAEAAASAPTESVEAEPAESESASESAPEAAAAAESDKPPRTVKYIMTTGGLEVEVDGVRFVPRATVQKSGKGWGVRVEVDAKVVDENAHSLLDPENGPLAFAGTLERGGKTSRIADQRKGEGEKLIGPGEKLKLKRDWPGKGGEAPLVSGETLTLEVGLWGLGPDADQRRPVRDFFQVKLRTGDGGAKPQPVITPPPSANP